LALLAVEKEEREAETEKFVEEIQKIDRDEELAEVLSLGQSLNMEAFPVLVFIFCCLLRAQSSCLRRL
jgi:hypothetical protein